jgi:hypothetical protein
MMEISSAPSQISTNCSTSLKMAESSPPKPTYTATVMEETQMLKLISQPSTTFMTSAMEYMLMPLMKHGHEAEGDGGEGARRFAEAQLEVAGDGVRLGDVIERDHHDPQEEHGGDGADPIPVRGQNAVLIGGAAQPMSSSEPRLAARKLRPAIQAVISRPARKKSSPVLVKRFR